MDQPLLQTKFLIPHSRPKQIFRPQLEDRLNAGRHRKLTLVSAPAGFGKTTLLSNWVHTLTGPAGWITVQEEDNDPARFLACLITVFRMADPPPAGNSPPSRIPDDPYRFFTGSESAAKPEAILVALINGITTSDRESILVFDDYHLIEETAVHRMMDFFLEHIPPSMHLIISTRVDPPIALPRLRARDEVTEIGPDLLRLSLPEAEGFLNGIMGLNLSPHQIRVLEERSEGWITGLQLAALSLRESRDSESFISEFAGDNHPIAEYLAAEVLDRQSMEVRDFLLRTSFLRRLHPDLCSAVLEGAWDTARCRDTLERLETANLFTTALDEQHSWFQYHALFSQYLRDRVRREIPDWEREVHHRAGRWFEEKAELEDALQHALALPDTEHAACLLEQYGSLLLLEGKVDIMLGWLKQLPEETIARSPLLALGCGWGYLLRGDLEKAEQYLLAGENSLRSFRPKYIAHEKRTISVEELRGDLATLRAFLCQARGDAAGMLEAARLAREMIQNETGENRQILEFNVGLMQLRQGQFAEARDSFSRAAARSTANRFVKVSAQSCEGDAWLAQGKLNQAEACYRKAIAFGQEGPEPARPIPAVFMGLSGLANVSFLRHDLSAASKYLDSCMKLATTYGDPRMLDRIFGLRVQCALAAGEWTIAERELQKAKEQAALLGLDILTQRFAIFYGYLDLAKGDFVTASSRLDAMAIPEVPYTDDLLWTDWWPAYLLSIRIDLLQHKTGRAMETLKRLEPCLAKYPSVIMILDWHLQRALVWNLRKDLPQALNDLRSALSLAEPEEIRQPFLNNRPDLDPLLRIAMAQGIHPDFVHRILALMENDFAKPAGLLTPRERQILQLLAEGLTSTEVARRLVIAVGTTRTYIREIYRKLEVHDRKEALETARKYGIL